MKKVALALLVVLTAASVSFAGWTPVVSEVVNDDVVTFTVGLSVDDAGGITSLNNLMLSGDAVQVFAYGAVATPTFEEANQYLAATGDDVKDSHLLDLSVYSNATDGVYLTKTGAGLTEASDGSAPVSATAPHVSGFGTTGMAATGTIAINNPDEGLSAIDFFQIVLPNVPNMSATIEGEYTNSQAASEQLPMVPFSITVETIPEPSTIVMLVLGALCLLGIRRK